MLINVRRTLAVIVSICNLHVIPFIKNYTETFHVVYIENLPSLHFKRRLHRSTSMGEVDDLSIILIDLHIQCSHDSTEVRPCSNFLRTKPSLRSVTQSLAKRAR
jgi:hypothetical protein